MSLFMTAVLILGRCSVSNILPEGLLLNHASIDKSEYGYENWTTTELSPPHTCSNTN